MSGRKSTLATYVTLKNGDMSGNLISASTDIRWMDNLVLYISYTGTPTGTFSVQVSPDNNSSWYDLLLTPAPVASGSGGAMRIALNELPDPYIRLKYTATSGAGSLTTTIAGKMI